MKPLNGDGGAEWTDGGGFLTNEHRFNAREPDGDAYEKTPTFCDLWTRFTCNVLCGEERRGMSAQMAALWGCMLLLVGALVALGLVETT
jgi:hypothetical protein